MLNSPNISGKSWSEITEEDEEENLKAQVEYEGPYEENDDNGSGYSSSNNNNSGGSHDDEDEKVQQYDSHQKKSEERQRYLENQGKKDSVLLSPLARINITIDNSRDLSTPPNTRRRAINDLTPYSSPAPSHQHTPSKNNNNNNLTPQKLTFDQTPKSPITPSSKSSTTTSNNNNNSNTTDIDPIVGTCVELEKKYFRLTSKAEASKVRPLAIIQTWLPKLLYKYKTTKNYDYTLDQLKSIRQDLVVQHIRNAFTLEVYESNAIISLENNDFSEFGQCISQIMLLYSNGIESKFKYEFISYEILFAQAFNPEDLCTVLANMPLEYLENEIVMHAFNITRSLASNNYHYFYQLYTTSYNHQKYLLDKMLTSKLRDATFAAMMKSNYASHRNKS
eukprot:gene18019-21509_t